MFWKRHLHQHVTPTLGVVVTWNSDPEEIEWNADASILCLSLTFGSATCCRELSTSLVSICRFSERTLSFSDTRAARTHRSGLDRTGRVGAVCLVHGGPVLVPYSAVQPPVSRQTVHVDATQYRSCVEFCSSPLPWFFKLPSLTLRLPLV